MLRSLRTESFASSVLSRSALGRAGSLQQPSAGSRPTSPSGQLAGLLVVCIGVVACTKRGDPPRSAFSQSARSALQKRVHESIQDGLIEHNLPSAVVAVGKQGNIVFAEGFGYADLESRRRATPDTPYSIASVSKPITAAAVMMLVDRGRMDLDAPINDYLGRVKLQARVGDAKDATLRRILNHTSGLPLHYNFLYIDQDYTPPSRSESIRRYGILMTKPGEVFQYSNFGYGLLGYAIEHMTKMSYAEFLRSNVFEPLDMGNSFVASEPPAEVRVATRYSMDGQAIPVYEFDHPAASAVYASALDLVKFGQFFIEADRGATEMLSREALKAMQSPIYDREGDLDYYGLGVVVWKQEGHRVLYHSGGMPGVSAEWLVLPDDEMVVAVMVNRGQGQAWSLVRRVLAVYIPELYEQTTSEVEAIQSLRGRWEGAVSLGDEMTERLVLVIGAGRTFEATLGGAPLHLISIQPKEAQSFELVFEGAEIQTPEAQRYPHRLKFHLKGRGEVLSGYVNAHARPERGRGGSSLPYWVELKRRVEDEGERP